MTRHTTSRSCLAVLFAWTCGCDSASNEPTTVGEPGNPVPRTYCATEWDTDVGIAEWELVVARNSEWGEDGLPNGVDLDGWDNSALYGIPDIRGCGKRDALGGVDNSFTKSLGLSGWGILAADRPAQTQVAGDEVPAVIYRLRASKLSDEGDDHCVALELDVVPVDGPTVTLRTLGEISNGELLAVFEGTYPFPIRVREPEGYPYPGCARSGCVSYDTTISARGIRLRARIDAQHENLLPGSAMGAFLLMGLRHATPFWTPDTFQPDSMASEVAEPIMQFGSALYDEQFLDAVGNAADLHVEWDDTVTSCGGPDAVAPANAISVGIPFTSR